jgi:hypothetical protein
MVSRRWAAYARVEAPVQVQAELSWQDGTDVDTCNYSSTVFGQRREGLEDFFGNQASRLPTQLSHSLQNLAPEFDPGLSQDERWTRHLFRAGLLRLPWTSCGSGGVGRWRGLNCSV